MVAKLKAIKAELQRRMHDRMADVSAWLRKVVMGYYQYHAVPGNTTQLRIFKLRACRLWQSVLVRRSQRAQMRWERFTPVLNRWIPPPAFCTPTPMLASTPLILRKSRMRKRARTDLCGGRPVMVVAYCDNNWTDGNLLFPSEVPRVVPQGVSNKLRKSPFHSHF
jgi:hypothetical protein